MEKLLILIGHASLLQDPGLTLKEAHYSEETFTGATRRERFPSPGLPSPKELPDITGIVIASQVCGKITTAILAPFLANTLLKQPDQDINRGRSGRERALQTSYYNAILTLLMRQYADTEIRQSRVSFY